ncbi:MULTISPECIES: hypothetical protein [Micrococcaceae]|uniref:hypothetical protein n=1 Tax=Micrococcaceae TaxID=1268 RepID=UPI000AFF1D85|nr:MULTISPECIES: hypothetical protein [Micrococcaceae]
MPSSDPLPPEHPPGPARRDTRPGSRKWWPLALVAAVVVIALIIFVLPLLQNGGGTPAATSQPTSEPTATATATATKSLPPAPPVTYYNQAGPPAGSPLTAVDAMTLKVSADKTGTSMPEGIVGLSLEATDLADTNLRGDNAEMVALLSGLKKPHLRFGGSSVDRRMYWTSTGEPIPGNLTGDKPRPVRAVTPADFERVNTLLEATDATISLTVDLGHFDPPRAADMMKYAADIFKARLVSVTVGNEPNGFPTSGVRPSGWDRDDYLAELKEYADAIFAVAPQVPLLGPGAYAESWWEPFVKTTTQQKKILSLHHYPLTSCDAKDPQSAPTMANLMTRQMHDRTLAYQKAALEIAGPAGLPVWIPETGISACDGANPTSRTHASALWSVDYILASAQNGIQRLGFHSSLLTCKGGPPLSPLCSGGAYLKPDGTVFERSPFFGMSVAADLTGGEFLKLETTGGGLAYGYALQNADGSTSVVIVNENDPTQAAQTSVKLELPGKALTGTMTQMTGPSYSAEGETKIDGALEASVPVASRPTVPGFAYGEKTQTFQLTAGTATVLNFTY